LYGVNPVSADPLASEFDFLAINVSADRELSALFLSSYASTVGTSFISLKV
jgi:hypothetical protein